MKIKSKFDLDNKKENHNETNINITGQNTDTKETIIFEHLIKTLETMNQSINRLDKTLGKLETRQDATDKMLQIIIEKVL